MVREKVYRTGYSMYPVRYTQCLGRTLQVLYIAGALEHDTWVIEGTAIA